MRGGATSSNLATTLACNPARGGSTMTTWLGVMKSRAFSLGARMARAYAEKITALQNGKMPIYELGLDVMVRHNVQEGRLSFFYFSLKIRYP